MWTRRRCLHLCWGIVVGMCQRVLGAAEAPPRILVLPWLVVDRTTNRECSREGTSAATTAEAQGLSRSAGEALDARLHRHGKGMLIPRREWQSHWVRLQPARLYRLGEGCAICTPPSELLRFDRDALTGLARATGADYVWLGLTVAPLTPETPRTRPDECCRAALGRGRSRVLARSSAILVRARDGEIVWQRDARRFEEDVPARVGKVVRRHPARLALAVDGTAHRLADAFAQEYPEALR